MPDESFTVAAIQATALTMDRDASTAKACRLIADAAATGAKLAAFSETWLPGYGGHGWTEMSGPDWWNFAADYNEQAVEVPSPTVDALCLAAKDAGIDVVIGIVERDRRTRGTLYCTLLFIGREGEVLGKHRKLKPTGGERLEWGEGRGHSLRVYDRGYAKISGLNCWEHLMPLSCFSLMAQGTQVHIAAWPGREPPAPAAPIAIWPRQHLHSRAFASSGACYVLCVGGVRKTEDVPEKYRAFVGPFSGDSVIIDPRGEIIAGPLHNEEGILTATVDPHLIRSAKAIMDCAGHYSRPDIFELRVEGRTIYGGSDPQL